MPPKYVAPSPGEHSFTCPRCGTLAMQQGGQVGESTLQRYTQCLSCRGQSIFEHSPKGDAPGQWRLVYPTDVSPAPEANQDMPDDVRADYDEAAAIVSRSPKGAAALLRLGLQRLCVHLGQPGRNINDDIQALVALGLPTGIPEMMDVLRITGNQSVHPGELRVDDDSELAMALFGFLNLIVEHMVSNPKQISAMWAKMPQRLRDAVAKRDGPAAAT